MNLPIKQAAEWLLNGSVVAVPTETVYGLAASLQSPHAIDQIFKLKGRPSNNPLIIHLAHPSQLNAFVSSIPSSCQALMKTFWPGPMTLVLPIDPEKIPTNARAGLLTAAFRIPNHPLTIELLKLTGPLVMPSANLSGKPSATQPEHVSQDFGENFPILKGGSCSCGLESTILYERAGIWEVIRLGALSAEMFESCLGYVPKISAATHKEPLCPGQLHRHYAPKAKLLLLDHYANCSGIILGFTDRTYSQQTKIYPFGSLSQPDVVASNLYKVLRQLDEDGIPGATVDMDFPRHGLWLTIAERLTRAAN